MELGLVGVVWSGVVRGERRGMRWYGMVWYGMV